MKTSTLFFRVLLAVCMMLPTTFSLQAQNTYPSKKGLSGEALEYYDKAVAGDALAQCLLGHCYLNGEGVTKDYAEAVKWFRKAAEQGQAEAKEALKALGVSQ